MSVLSAVTNPEQGLDERRLQRRPTDGQLRLSPRNRRSQHVRRGRVIPSGGTGLQRDPKMERGVVGSENPTALKGKKVRQMKR